jgi:hypothetical protein
MGGIELCSQMPETYSALLKAIALSNLHDRANRAAWLFKAMEK